MTPADSGEEENDPDAPPLPSTYNGKEKNDPDLTSFPPVDSDEGGKTSNDMSVTCCGSTLDLGSQTRKCFEGLGWFYGAVVGDLLDGENNQIYNIRFTDDKEENLSAHDVTVNTEAGSIAIEDVGYKFIR